MDMKKKGVLLIVLLLAFVRLSAPDEDLWAISLDKVNSIVSILDNSYFKDLDSEKLAYASIHGLLETLDPHSYFLEPENFLRMREDYVGKYYGLGIQIQKQEDRLVVIAPSKAPPPGAWASSPATSSRT